MTAEQVRTLSQLTTLGIGGPIGRLEAAYNDQQLAQAVAAADGQGEAVMVLGGGSNLVVGDRGFDGTVVLVRSSGVEIGPPRRSQGQADRGDAARASGGTHQLVRAQAGEVWADLVERTVKGGLAGIECLAGIPGLVGATPIQNVGAYGQEVAQTIVEVRAWDRDQGAEVTLDGTGCEFSYRDSLFKRGGRHVILEVTFRLPVAETDDQGTALSAPVRYAELARQLGVEVGERAPIHQVMDTVLALRRGKGMVLDPADPDTRSAGSFFTNPVLSPEQLSAFARRVQERLGPAASFPSYRAEDGGTKIPAAWLIEHAGFAKGYRVGDAAISSKHTLALTVRAGSSAGPLLDLAREIRAGVASAFGLRLVPEPVLVGAEL